MLESKSIVKYPDPRLRMRVEKLSLLQSIIVAQDLMELCLQDDFDWLVGLSSIQMDMPGRVITYRDKLGVWHPMINPVVKRRSETHWDYVEGCGSLPGVFVKVRRPMEIAVEYNGIEGTRQGRSFLGNPGRSILHEIDHLDGILIIDYGDPYEPEKEESPPVLSDEEGSEN